MADELYDLRIALLLGNYATVINEGAGRTSRKMDEAQIWERDFIMLRAHLALRQYDVATQELAKRSTPTSKAAALLVQYLKAAESNNLEGMTNAVEGINAAAAEVPAGQWASNISTCVCAVTVFTRERLHPQSLTLLNTVVSELSGAPSVPQTAVLELRGLTVDNLLRIHRVDLAEREVAEMNKIDDDSVYSTLSSIALCLNQGYTKPDRLREALQLTNDIRDKYGNSVLLLNLMATSNLLQERYQDAERCLLDALEKRSSDVDTLVALCVVSLHLKKSPELVNRYLSQLKTSSPYHPWVQNYVATEQRVSTMRQ
eukprot:PhM_4_TR10954/c0_g1_i1/m.36426/K17268/COPE; coatomer subunit epsilon